MTYKDVDNVVVCFESSDNREAMGGNLSYFLEYDNIQERLRAALSAKVQKDYIEAMTGGAGGSDGGDMINRIAKVEAKVDTLDKKADKIGAAVHLLRDRMVTKEDIENTIGRDIKWLQWIIGIGATAILAAMVYLFTRQDTLSNQMIDLLQQLVNK